MVNKICTLFLALAFSFMAYFSAYGFTLDLIEQQYSIFTFLAVPVTFTCVVIAAFLWCDLFGLLDRVTSPICRQ